MASRLVSLLVCALGVTAAWKSPPRSPSRRHYRTSPSLSAAREWEECAGCKVLRPPEDVTPRAMIHFLGGTLPHKHLPDQRNTNEPAYTRAHNSQESFHSPHSPHSPRARLPQLDDTPPKRGCEQTYTSKPNPDSLSWPAQGAFVSPQPTVAYRHVLESLATRGYLVVATPFGVDFNYRLPAAAIRDDFVAARHLLLEEYGVSLPRVSMGHSLGALMHVLLACEYPADFAEGTAGAALISYNNKEVDGAIPFFKQLFVPALAPLEPLTREAGYTEALNSLKDFRKTGFQSLRDVANTAKDALKLGPNDSLIPGVEPLVLRALDDAEAAAQLIDQIPGVVESISRGASEFEPTPTEMRAMVASSFKPPSPPLIVSFSDDGIDESDVLTKVLSESQSEYIRKSLDGTHVTPLGLYTGGDSLHDRDDPKPKS